MLACSYKQESRLGKSANLLDGGQETDFLWSLSECGQTLTAAYSEGNTSIAIQTLGKIFQLFSDNNVSLCSASDHILRLCIEIGKTTLDAELFSAVLEVLCCFLKLNHGDEVTGALFLSLGFFDLLSATGEAFDATSKLPALALFASQSLECRDAVLSIDDDMLKNLLQMATVRECHCVFEILEVISSLLTFPLAASGLSTTAQIMHAIIMRGKEDHIAHVIDSLEVASQFQGTSITVIFDESELIDDLKMLFNVGKFQDRIIKILAPYYELRGGVPLSLWRRLIEIRLDGSILDDEFQNCTLRILHVVLKHASDDTIEILLQSGITLLLELSSEEAFPVRYLSACLSSLLLRRGTRAQRLQAFNSGLLENVFDLFEAQNPKGIVSGLKAIRQVLQDLDGNDTENVISALYDHNMFDLENSSDAAIRAQVIAIRNAIHVYL